ncbi:MAG TPA: polysaccharide deacetylase family protein [Ohtaekwangia sp.]|uniref:polysaccharide deacetylase family protein n=1 Tax=Ohtaekwangia sp. TaxID=2066019 RepID=UPI002F94FAFA
MAQQKQVAITLDDVPFTSWPGDAPLKTIVSANENILTAITTHSIPTTIFINENTLIHDDQTEERIAVLKQWLINPLITPGNHTYSHPSYARTSSSIFKDEIIKGEVITKKLLEGTGKSLTYFRFPYNALGMDSLTKIEMQSFLQEKGYISTPFTIESSDYMFNALYLLALDNHDKSQAQRIGQAYIDYTLRLFDHFENIGMKRYGTSIPQIFLGHVNALHADYLGVLIEQLKKKGYTFTDLRTALQNDVYKQTDYYAGPYGFSWFFRWEKDPQVRRVLLRQQPEPPKEFTQAYEQALKKASGK